MSPPLSPACSAPGGMNPALIEKIPRRSAFGFSLSGSRNRRKPAPSRPAPSIRCCLYAARICSKRGETPLNLIWSHRPIEKSIHSLVHLGWWPGREEFVQRQLYDAASQFLQGRPHLRVELADLRSNPSREVERLIHFLRSVRITNKYDPRWLVFNPTPGRLRPEILVASASILSRSGDGLFVRGQLE